MLGLLENSFVYVLTRDSNDTRNKKEKQRKKKRQVPNTWLPYEVIGGTERYDYVMFV